jgi:tRNA threonylcarbamoyl adenosine modification protein YeaZ
VIILGVDTSLPLLSVALIRDEAVLGAVALEGKGSRNEKLLPAIDWLLVETATARADIDLYAVTRGPGSFTGVRIGLATVQGMALALGKPVCAMSTHEAIALPVARSVVVDDAGRGEFYVSVYEGGQEIEAPHLAKQAPELEPMWVADAVRNVNVALRCAQRAAKIAAQGRLAEYADITPIYVRLAEAEVKLQQKRDGN